MLMLPEKDDDGRQVLILRPGDHCMLWFSAADVYWLQYVYDVINFLLQLRYTSS